MVTDELLEEFKGRFNFSHNSQDGDFKKLLSYSIDYIRHKCGEFKIDGDKHTDKLARELVFERTRYAYNDALEYFEENFKSEIFSLGIEMAGDTDEEV
ncbi:phage gp6-like head-tail connector protein [Virgibacillus kimchii]